MKFLNRILILAAVPAMLSAATAAVVFPGPPPGAAGAVQSGSAYTLSNSILTAKFLDKNGSISFGGLTSKLGPVARREENCSSSTWQTDGASNLPN